MSEKIVKEYSNGEVTVIWKPDLCIHSQNCVQGLPKVFDFERRPWIKLDESDTVSIVAQVKQCPSGALSYRMENMDDKEKQAAKKAEQEAGKATKTEITVSPNGPLMVKGDCIVVDADGNTLDPRSTYALCRCGASSNKPFCDGSHRKVGFEG